MKYTLGEIKDGTGFERGATFYAASSPLAERAPEVTQLLAAIWEVAEGESWPGGDTVSILCEWFTANGYDIDAPLPAAPADTWYEGNLNRDCAACGAEPGEECRPMCIGQAAQMDALGIDVTEPEGIPWGGGFRDLTRDEMEQLGKTSAAPQ